MVAMIDRGHKTARDVAMGKKKTGDSETGSKQVNFRADAELYSRLEWTAKVLGVDVSNFVRMALKEILPTFEQRARSIVAQEEKSS